MKKYLAILISIISISCSNENTNKNIDVFIGTYTEKEAHVDGKADGIYKGKFNLETGDISDITTIVKIKNPSYLRVVNNANNILAVSELGPNYDKFGELISLKKNNDNSYSISDVQSSMAYAPCHVNSDTSGKNIFTANYMNGVLTYHKLDDKGSLSLSDTLNFNHSNEKESHLHQVIITGNTLFVPDLGKDKIWIIEYNPQTAKFSKSNIDYLEIEEGSGPRHIVISNDEKNLFCVSEYSNTIDFFQKDNLNNYQHIQRISTLPSDIEMQSYSAEIVIHPNQKFIYSSNRGHNSVAAFKLEEGKLKSIDFFSSHGEFPRSINIDPSGKFLLVANQNSDNIFVYKIDNNTGELVETNKNINVKTPVDIEF